MTSGDAAMSGEDLKSATEEQLRAAVEAAEIAALLPTLAHLTGDLGLLREELRPDQLLLMQDDGGLLPDVAAQAREAALEALIRHRDARSDEHTSELQSLMRTSSAVFCLKQHKTNTPTEA